MIKRSYASLYRKPVQTGIMFLIFVIVSTLVVVGILIYNSAQATKKDIFIQLGSKISIGVDMSNPMNVTEQKYSESASSFVPNTHIPQEAKDSVLAIPHVMAYEATTAYVNGPIKPLNFRNIKTFTGIDPSTQNSYNKVEERILKDCVYMLGSTAIPYRDQFRKHMSDLILGVYPSDQNRGALISKELASENNLYIGDEIHVQYYLDDGIGFNDKIEITVVGIFETSLSFLVGEGNTMGEAVFQFSPYNVIFIDYQTACEVSSYDGAISYCAFFLDSPDNIDYVLDQASKLPLDWEKYTLENVTATYFRQLTEPVDTLISRATYIIWFSTVGGIILFLLVASYWNKNFKYDIGVLISLGEKKINIILQKLVESSTLSICAVLPSIILGRVITEILSSSFSQGLVTNDPYVTSMLYYTGEWEIEQKLIISFDNSIILYALLFALIISVVYTVMSMLQVAKYNTRQIFASAE